MIENITIKQVKSKEDFLKFVKLPWEINKNDPCWVPPLIMDKMKLLDKNKNPFLKNNPHILFLAYKNDKVVGRIGAFTNEDHAKISNESIGFFGFLEGFDDIKIFKALLESTETWLASKKCKKILGPINPTTNDELGFLVNGFGSPPFFMLSHNPKYYDQFMICLGYIKAKDFHSYIANMKDFKVSNQIKRVNKLILKRYPVSIRSGSMENFKEEIRIINNIYNDAFSNHWGFSPMSNEQSDFFSSDLKLIIDPDFVLFAEYENKPIGFMLAIPNINEVFMKIRNGKLFPNGWIKFLINKKKIKSVRIITLGIKKKFQPFGIGSLFYEEMGNRIKCKGYTQTELSWVMEDNMPMINVIKEVGGVKYKTYRVYEKLINNPFREISIHTLWDNLG